MLLPVVALEDDVHELGQRIGTQAQFVDHDKVRCEPRTKEELRPQMELQRLLVAQGWRVRQIKTFNGCYEVYGFDEKGQRTEAFFDPKTFEKIGQVKQ